MIPPKDKLTVCFAHVAYQFAEKFAKRQPQVKSFQVWKRDELDRRVEAYRLLGVVWHEGDAAGDRPHHRFGFLDNPVRITHCVVALDDEDRRQHRARERSKYSHTRELPVEPIF